MYCTYKEQYMPLILNKTIWWIGVRSYFDFFASITSLQHPSLARITDIQSYTMLQSAYGVDTLQNWKWHLCCVYEVREVSEPSASCSLKLSIWAITSSATESWQIMLSSGWVSTVTQWSPLGPVATEVPFLLLRSLARWLSTHDE